MRKVKTWKDRLRGHKDSVIFLTMPDGPEGVHLLSVSADASLRLWDLKERVVRKKLELSHPKEDDKKSSKDGGLAAAGGAPQGPGGSLEREPGSSTTGLCTAFCLSEHALAQAEGEQEGAGGSAGGQVACGFIYGGYEGGIVAEWEAENGDFVRDFVGHKRSISCIRTKESQGGASLFTASWDGTLRVWNLGRNLGGAGAGGGEAAQSGHSAGDCNFVFEFGLGNPVADFHFLGASQPQGATPAGGAHAAHGGGGMHGKQPHHASGRGMPQTPQRQQDPGGGGGGASNLATIACLDGNLRILDLAKKECKLMCEASSTAGLRCVCLREQRGEEPQVFLGTDDCRISGWKIPPQGNQLTLINSWKAHGSEVTFLRYVEERLYSASEDGYIKVWEPKQAYLLDEMCGHEGGVLTFMVADKLIYSGSRDHSIRSWCMQEMDRRIWERDRMCEAEMASRRYETYHSIMGTGKKKKQVGGRAAAAPKKKGKK